MSRGPKNWDHARAACLVRDDYLCQVCRVAEATDADHIWPKSAGGTDDMHNLQAACSPCNRAKSDSYELDDATMQQLLWLNNRNNEKLAAANAAVWQTRFLIAAHGSGLARSPQRTVSTVPADEIDDLDAMPARVFSMLTRKNWVGNSYAAVNVEQIASMMAEARAYAEDISDLISAECEAAERLINEMAEGGDETFMAYLFRTGRPLTAEEALTGVDIFDMFFGSGRDS